ncbi:hypothetical protein HY988_00710 [Candidatus Micrarchaeota archaeon]|nr:hypothetical protein [Candidatus Micrarchaeota archaeon]
MRSNKKTNNKKNDRKGFLFTVTVFLILAYILLSISVWVKAVETSERSFSDFYKQSAVELAISQITPAKVGNITHEIMARNLFKLNQNAIQYPLLKGPDNDQNIHIRNAMYQMLLSGVADKKDFQGLPPDQANPSNENSSLTAWISGLNASLLSTGVYVSSYQISGFALNQSAIDKVNYSLVLHLELKDTSNSSSVSRTYPLSGDLEVTGLIDPALAKASIDSNLNQHFGRQFFFNTSEYPDKSKVSVSQIKPSEEGQGWFYGYLASATPSNDPSVKFAKDPEVLGNASQYIIVGKYDDIIKLKPEIYKLFGGYIITSNPLLEPPSLCPKQDEDPATTFNPLKYDKNCKPIKWGGPDYMGKPFVISFGFDPLSAGICPDSSSDPTKQRRCALIIAKSSPSDVLSDPDKKTYKSDSSTGIFNIEPLRDFVMCGYYTHNEKAPSYLQHLMVGSYSLSDKKFGIETFVVGEYSNKVLFGRSRLDRELFSSQPVYSPLRGLPGCRNAEVCSDSPTTGIFTLSDTAIKDYVLDPLSCKSGAGCKQ